VAGIRIEQLAKSYGTEHVLDIAALDVADGEFFSLLGPSGCGKTTALRAVAGTLTPDRGRIFIGDREVTTVPPHRRNVGMVFQRYALFPHLTVRENVAYGLEGRGLTAAAIAAQVDEALGLAALSGFDTRYPHQLSGGQQQRVAMARAIAYRPDVLLLDEPFSSLDARLRTTLRSDLKRLQQAIRITTLFVTHDQQEALALSDRIAVMQRGRIEQVDTPQRIYERPASRFVADFVGGTNLIDATIVVAGADGVAVARVGDHGTLAVSCDSTTAIGARVSVMVKPEHVQLAAREGDDELAGEVIHASYLGASHSYVLAVGGQRIEARLTMPVIVNDRPAHTGDRLTIRADAPAVRLVPE
jgi:ABC-type Fe3+/spermidine/putrescine transport system ATPase subunit